MLEKKRSTSKELQQKYKGQKGLNSVTMPSSVAIDQLRLCHIPRSSQKRCRTLPKENVSHIKEVSGSFYIKFVLISLFGVGCFLSVFIHRQVKFKLKVQYILLMSTAKRHLQTQAHSNSLLDFSLSSISSDRSLPITAFSNIKAKYRQELLTYKAEQEDRVKQRLMKLDYVIRNTVEINQIIDKTVMRR